MCPFLFLKGYIDERLAGVAESADAMDSKSISRKGVGVQVPPPAPTGLIQEAMGPPRSERLVPILSQLVLVGKGIRGALYIPTIRKDETLKVL